MTAIILPCAACGERKILLDGSQHGRPALCAIRFAGIRKKAGAILNLLPVSNQSALTLLEQARFIDELHQRGDLERCWGGSRWCP
jgi:hypothetical protein